MAPTIELSNADLMTIWEMADSEYQVTTNEGRKQAIYRIQEACDNANYQYEQDGEGA